MRVLVCGGRSFGVSGSSEVEQGAYLRGFLDGLHAIRPFDVLIHGTSRGADTDAAEWGRDRLGPESVIAFPAHWRHGKDCLSGCRRIIGAAAGPIRNQQMIDEAKADLVIAFPGGKGTADLVTRAKKAQIPVIEAMV